MTEQTPTGNPHDYVDEDGTKDGLPFDDPNSEHLAGRPLSKQIEELYDLEDRQKLPKSEVLEEARDLLKQATSAKDKNDLKKLIQYCEYAIANDDDYSSGNKAKKLTDGEPGQQPVDDIQHAEAPGVEQESLVGTVEHEGHSAGIFSGPSGHSVRGRGSAAYLKSEPITQKEHAMDFAKEALKAHAKLTEREIVQKNTNLSEVDDHRLGWDAVTPKEKRNVWDSLTRGSQHKISACMAKVEGHVDNPGAYCKSLADEVGYKPM